MKFIEQFPEHIVFALRIFLPPFLVLTLAKLLFELLAFDFLDLNQMLVQKISASNNVPAQIMLSEFKARLMWLTSVLAYFFIMAGFGVFIWHTLKNSISKSTLWFFIAIASIITTFETIYLLSVDSRQSPIASIFRFTFDTLYSSGLFSMAQLSVISTTLNIINFLSFLVVPFGIIAGCLYYA